MEKNGIDNENEQNRINRISQYEDTELKKKKIQ